MTSNLNFLSKNFEQFCKDNGLEKTEARKIVFEKISELLTNISFLEKELKKRSGVVNGLQE